MCVCTPLEVLQCYNLGKTEGFSASKCYKWATNVLQGATSNICIGIRMAEAAAGQIFNLLGASSLNRA